VKFLSSAFLLALLFCSCKQEEIQVQQSGVVSDVLVDHAMAVQLGYPSDTVYTCYITNIVSHCDEAGFAAVGIGDWKSYYLEVRDKYNKIIFSTNDREKKWDVSFGSNPINSGVYYYYVEIATGTPKAVHKYAGGVFLTG
jgi:hypothetical protein